MGDDGLQLRRADAHFAAARAAIERFGWRSAPSKEVPPTSCELDVLGVQLDLV